MSNQVLARLRKPKNGTSSTDGNHDRFRVAVFGQTGVGKTALSVRFITRRYIGEYDSSSESIYQRLHVVPPYYPVFFEIMDTPGQQENGSPLKEKIKWADAFLLVYAINDPISFTEIIRLKFLITYILTGNSNKGRNGCFPPIIMVGNKTDLEVERMVSKEEGTKTAADLRCPFFETSARHSLDEVMEIFESIYRQSRKLDTGYLCSNNSVKHGKLGRCGSEGHIHTNVIQRTPRIRQKSFKHINKIQRIQAGVTTQSSSPGSPPTTMTSSSEGVVSTTPPTVTSHSPLLRLKGEARSFSDSESGGVRRKKMTRGASAPIGVHSRTSPPKQRCESPDPMLMSNGNSDEMINPKHAAEDFMKKVLQLKAD